MNIVNELYVIQKKINIILHSNFNASTKSFLVSRSFDTSNIFSVDKLVLGAKFKKWHMNRILTYFFKYTSWIPAYLYWENSS